MPTDDRIRKRGAARMPILILGFSMTAFYIILGSWIFLDKTFLAYIPAEFRNIFAGMLLVYGIYRGWRVYADHF